MISVAGPWVKKSDMMIKIIDMNGSSITQPGLRYMINDIKITPID
jgi:hypothetical protein